MKETAINSIYLLMHCIEETNEELELAISEENGLVWEAYFRKDAAEAEAKHLNETFGSEGKRVRKHFKHRWIVIEKTIY